MPSPMSGAVAVVALVAIAISTAAPARAWERLDLERAWRDAAPREATAAPPTFSHLLGADLRHVATSPARLRARGWLAAAAFTGALVLRISHEDGDLGPEPPEGTATERNVARIFEPFGQERSIAVLAGFLAVGAVRHDRRAIGVAEDGAIASILASGLITPLVKEVAGRSRPRQSASGSDFRPYSGHASFPSGHTTQAFAVASVIATEYRKPWVDVAAYGTASLVGYARTLHDRHYLSDVVAGAAIGTLVGRSVVLFNHRLRGREVAVAPLLEPGGGAGIVLDVGFVPDAVRHAG